MKRIKIYTIVLLVCLGTLSGCTGFLDPMLDGSFTEQEAFQNAAYYNGLLNTAYNNVGNQYEIELDCATDNAVINVPASDYFKLGNNSLNPYYNPTDNWVTSFIQIRRINQFLGKMVLNYANPNYITPVRWRPLKTAADSVDNVNTFYRLLGEAYFLRGYFEFGLLQKFGGEGVNGQILGFPIVKTVLETNDNLNLPRNTYQECVAQIKSDCDSAIKYLPLEYKGANIVLGQTINGRANGIAARALKARTLLYAASPAFNKSGDIKLWEDAAVAAGDAIKLIGGLLNLAPVDNFYFAQLNNATYQIRDIFFRGVVQSGNRTYETNNYPPGMFGNGMVNPSQNYVNSFPDMNGYPINESALYSSANPYAKRDPRLNLYVAVNGSKLGPANYYTIQTYKDGADAFNPSINTSRTNYYLTKLLRKGTVQLIPTALLSTTRAAIYLGCPELYLNFAEAAFEAWGTNKDPKGYGFNAQTVLARVLLRYGSGNAYLNTVAVNDNAKFRKFVRNERRLELSFEGHYFWDLRRWAANSDVSALNTVVYGAELTKDNLGNLTYNLNVPLEQRKFSTPFMPISYEELFKASNLVQNKGW